MLDILYQKSIEKKEEIKKLLPTQEEERALYYFTRDRLQEAGYHQYEISNFAKEGFEDEYHELDVSHDKIVITAGPTYEKIDPVRFIGNYSSGKMGFALAETCAQQGAEVTLIAGPVALKAVHPNIKRVDVESAEEMYQAAMKAFPESDAAILCAAVADYRPEIQATNKIKRETEGEMTLHLVPNKDIAASLGAIKRDKQLLVGFALETNNETTHATSKLKRKNLDFIVLNSLRDAGAGFRCDTNKITIIDSNGQQTAYPLKSKQEVAEDIVNKLASLLK